MSEVTHYGYVKRPFQEIRTILQRDPRKALQQATHAGATRAQDIYTELRVGDRVRMGVDVSVSVDRIRDGQPIDGKPDTNSTFLDLTWKSASAPFLFPLMHATLSVWPVVANDTQVLIEGHYDPPLGFLGEAVDAALGHRVAQATVHHFLNDVIDYLGRAPA
jgi:hypothetical protein